jgi:hypothetical protein
VSQGQSYVVSYYTTTGFSYSTNYFASSRNVPPLSVAVAGGVYGSGPNPTFPTQVYSDSSYWADVVFQPTPKVTSLFGNTSAPDLSDPGGPFELGVQFTSDVAGAVTAFKFYKYAGSTGAHVGHLWDGSGNLLATQSFTNETASGWQTQALPSPIPLNASTQYVVSYSTSAAYALDEGFFGPGFDRPPLHVPQQGGVFSQTLTTFPTQTFNGTNYWVDISFQPSQPNSTCVPICSGVSCGGADGCGGTCCTGSGCTVSATCDPQCQTVNACGNGCNNVADNTSCTASGGGAGTCQSGACLAGAQASVFNNMGTPASEYLGGGDNYELGMQFTSDNAGNVIRVRFYKAVGASGTHVGHLWDGSGNLLGSVTFTNETASGWQEATFASPIAIAASTLYVISYSEINGFPYTLNQFQTGLDVPPLHVPAPGGVYATPGGNFPTQVYADSNYWVDVVVSY